METKLDSRVKKQHTISLESRGKATLSGVERVVNSSDTSINLVTSEGGLSILGRDFKIEKFNIEDGSLILSGVVDSVKYSAAKVPFLKRLFK